MIRVTITGDDPVEALDSILDKLQLDIDRELKLRTPVDKGRARAGWEVDTKTRTNQNNVEYIEPLNAGHSSQAPAGYVENAIDAVVDK